MARKYPAKMFWLFVCTNFFLNYFFLSLPGLVLCLIGIWVKKCLWIGMAILGLDLILSLIRQLRFRKAALAPSDNADYNAFMDAFCGPDGLHAVKELTDRKIAEARRQEGGTPLKQEDIQLGPMLDQYWHGCDYYDAANHRVMKYICIPDGPQGFGPIKVPDEITTLEQLLPWLVEKHDFHLKEED